MMRAILAAGLLCLAAFSAEAQQTKPDAVNGGIYNSTPPTLTNYQTAPFQMDANGNLKITGSFSATTTGFTPNGTDATPLSVSNSTSETALPAASAVVLVQNIGSNVAYIKLGTTSGVTATTSDLAVPALGGCTVTVGANGFIAGITASSTTTLNLIGGSGLGNTCYGGGAGAGASSNVNLTQVGGSNIALGSALSAASLPVVIASDQSAVTVVQPTAANLKVTATGSASAGTPATGVLTVQGITGMTPVQVSQATASNLNATVIGAGTAGSANSGVVTIQGIASMTPILATATLNQGGSVLSATNGIFSAITDNTNGPAAVKAASTAPAATDKALVVAVSPNTGTANNAAAGNGSLVQGIGFGSGVTEPTKVTSGNTADDFRDLVGKEVTSPYANRENYVRGSASKTDTSAGTILAASGSASLKEYVTDVECGRTDAGTTAIYVTLNDGASTILVLPNNGGGGGNNSHFLVPLVVAANTALTFTASSGVSTVYCSAQGYYGY